LSRRAAVFRPPRAALLPRGRLPVFEARGRPEVPPCGREAVLGARVAMMPTVASICPTVKDAGGVSAPESADPQAGPAGRARTELI
jgi:hypothetical protein